MDPVRGIYTVTPGLHMHNSSPASTRALLQRLAELGTALRRVQEFCAEILAPGAGICTMTSNGVGGVEEQADSELLQQLPTAAAFAAALDTQLKVWGQAAWCAETPVMARDACLLPGGRSR